MQTTSEDKGIPFLEAHEGVALTAYRCPAGKWTIGAGLTAASGVVEPRRHDNHPRGGKPSAQAGARTKL